MTRLLTTAFSLATLLALTGCDELILFDVTADGRILAPVDADGRVAALGKSSTPRHLVLLDPVSGKIERLTRDPLALSCPRACGEGVTLVIDGQRLLHFVPGQSSRPLFESRQRLFLPTPSPDGSQVAVLEAERAGVPGALYLIDVASGVAVGEPIQGVLPGFTWAGEALVFARSQPGAATQPFQPCEGEVLMKRGSERRVLYRGTLPGATLMAGNAQGLLAALPRADQTLGLALLSLERPGATPGEPGPGVDMWPSCGPDGRVLFTRAEPGRPSIIDGHLRITSLEAPGRSVEVPTPGPVRAPRWVGGDGRVAYLTPGDRLVTQRVDGSEVVDWTERLRVAAGGAP